MAVRAGPSLPFRRAPLRISWLPTLAPDRLTVPSAWKPSSQYMLPVTVKPVGGKGGPVLSVQVRRPEVQLAPDAGAVQADLPVGLEPLVADHVAGDHEPFGGKGRPAVSVQVRAAEVERARDTGAVQAGCSRGPGTGRDRKCQRR